LAEEPIIPKSLFVGDMWAVFNFANPNERYQRFLQNGKPRFTHLLDGLLLYEEAVIPTQDFMSLALLAGVLGERTIIDLLESGDLRFVRVKGGIAYIGSGRGLEPFEMLDENQKPTACFANEDDTISWALNGLNPPLTDPALPKAVLSRTITLDVTQLRNELRRETYSDILNSGHLRNLFAIRNKDLDHLIGIEAGQVRCFGGADEESRDKDEIDTVLHICAANLELRVAQFAKCDDSSTANPVGHLLKAKIDRTFGTEVPFRSLVHLMELEGIPDIASAVLENPIESRSTLLTNLMKVKRSRDGAEFRKWFHESCRGEHRDVARNYVELLKRIPTVNRMPLRILRFLLTSAIGVIPVIGNVLGVGASAIDSFFVERWFRGASPKFFIENLKQTVSEVKRD
jgi:hypothetical protein